jgi:AcrR family transcriptional regulator
VQSRSHKTRAALATAAKREFSTRGYAETTAKSIAERAGVGTGTFYFYFPDKDAALGEICAQRVQALLDETAPLAAPAPENRNAAARISAARRRLEKLVQLYLDYHRTDRGIHAVIAERRLCDPSIEAIMVKSEHEAVLRLSNAIGGWGSDGDREASAFMMFSLLEGAVHGHVFSAPMLSDERFASAFRSRCSRSQGPLPAFERWKPCNSPLIRRPLRLR